MPEKPKTFLVCNAHLDPVWLWEWEEGVAATLSTFRVAADICDEFPGFVFNHNEAILYEWVEEYEPVLFARIQQLVKQGKWHIMGGWYLQPDCNMPSGESLVRQIQAGRSYFAEKFGVSPTTAINFDPFGHTRGLVQILVKSGFDSYLFTRPGWSQCPLPSETFTWVGYDGSEVMATRSGYYNSPLGKATEKINNYVRDSPDLPTGLVLWGVGNHGGGPSRQDVAAINTLQAGTSDREILHATPESYFADLRRTTDLPRHEHDLNPWAVGCYTSQVRIKQKHRQLENAIYRLEKMAASAWVQEFSAYPAAGIQDALKDLLFAEFHDILPGSSVQPVEDYSLRVLDHGLETASRLTTKSFYALASGQPQAADGEIPILVYNPHPYPLHAIVECEFQLADQNWTDNWTFPTVYAGETKLETQIEKELSSINLDWRKRVVFSAALKPFQMNRFDCRLETRPRESMLLPDIGPEMYVFKTPDIEVQLNCRTGLMDKYQVQGVDYLESGAFCPLVLDDSDDPWEMQAQSFDKVIGAFALMLPEDSARFSGVSANALAPMRIIEDGAVRTVIEAVFQYGHSSLCLHYKLPKHGTEIEVDARVFWNEKSKMLKLSLLPEARNAEYLGQVAYGVESLPTDGKEAVSQKWAAVMSRSENKAVTLISDGGYGSDYSPEGWRPTLLRSPAYSAHPINDRPIVPQDRFLPRIDQGERLFHFWLNAGPVTERLESD